MFIILAAVELFWFTYIVITHIVIAVELYEILCIILIMFTYQLNLSIDYLY